MENDVHQRSAVAPEQALYLGFSDISALDILSVYWSLNASTVPGVSWYCYTQAKTWVSLDATLRDNTAGLSSSGLWQVTLPADIAPGGDSLSEEYYWIKALPPQGNTLSSADAPKLNALFANAMTASLNTATEIDNSHFAQALPVNSINQLVSPITQISNVSQPLPSTGGKTAETEQELFARAATRISHRQRAITWGNMRDMLKENYPQIHDVQFPNVEKLKQIPALETQQLLVIPDSHYRDNDDALRPTLSAGRLGEMAAWLEQYTSLWAKPQLNNPEYVDVIARYRVVFQSGVNESYGYQQLAVQLQQAYLPWRENQQQAITPGNRIDYYRLLAQLQQSPLVERVLTLTLERDGATPEREAEPAQHQSIIANDNEVLILIPQSDAGNQSGEAYV